MALLACNQFSLASPTGSPVSLNTSGKKYGKNLPSVYLTPGTVSYTHLLYISLHFIISRTGVFPSSANNSDIICL